MKVIVASMNPVKIQAALQGVKKLFPNKDITAQGVSVPSGVPDQPMHDKETLLGAKTRANNAKHASPDADLRVGIEGGIDLQGGEMQAYAWVVILSKNQSGKARTSTFYLPPKVAELVTGGMELGHADDIVFKRDNSKQQNGAVGLLTNDVISRTDYYTEAVVLAMIPHLHTSLYPGT